VKKAFNLGVRSENDLSDYGNVFGHDWPNDLYTLTNEIQILFRKEVYASACLVLAILYLVFDYFQMLMDYNLIINIFLIFSIRLISVKYKLSLPRLDLRIQKGWDRTYFSAFT